MAVVKILLVDEDKAFVDATKLYLEKLNQSYNVSTSNTANNAEKLLKKTVFDVIISDYLLPGKNGLSFLSDLRSSGNKSIFIMFTGISTEDVIIEALNLGADYYILKGGDPKNQFKELSNLLEKSIKNIAQLRRVENTINLERKAFQLIAESAIGKSQMTNLCNDVLRDLVTTLGFDIGTIRLYNPITKILKLTAFYGTEKEKGKLVIDQHLDDDNSFISVHVANSRIAIISADVNKSKELHPYMERIKELKIQSIITWPIVSADNKLLGIIHLASKTPKDIPSEKWIFFETIVRFFATILERKNAEKSLRFSEERYRKLVETSPLSILVTDLTGKILMINQESLDLYGGVKEEELIGKSAFELIAKEDQKLAAKNLEKTKRTGRTKNLQYTMLRKDGSKYIGELNATLLTDADGKPTAFLGVIQDVTKRLKTQEVLNQNQKMLKKQRDELEEFATTIAHDIRGKLQIISMYNSMSNSDFSDKVDQQIIETTNFLEDLLFLAKEGEILGEVTSVNLTDLANELVLEIKSLDPNLTINIRDLPTIKGDRVKLKQVFENLLINVIKHADATKVHIIGKDFPHKKQIEIQDNGRGMPIERQKEVRKAWTKESYASFGLLIAIKIVEAHGGSMGFESEEGLGTIFVITFPKKR